MIIKTGVDLLPIHKIGSQLHDEKFLNLNFHPFERHSMDVTRLASIYALKECVFKALDIVERDWLLIEVFFSAKGKPRINLSKKIILTNLESMDCSVSFENGYVLANVVILLK
ncbi:MAG: 4'-phosphopantetheinyl transferase superfamily protein [Candidatus Falkowbacteria bacterium]|nr:4'-phosphopantetheinyl transferase superfamily protein [Candidatus Falkowbacteria bacterium]